MVGPQFLLRCPSGTTIFTPSGFMFTCSSWRNSLSESRVPFKQCNSFKTRANQVKGGLEIGVPGITVLINPDKPRRGCFEIREEGGETFISLLGLKRPFKPMKDLNMEEVIGNIIEKIK
ncbi:sodium/potassium/calcium exchanger 1 [Prunus yedoensis var. nudiflora]|uniref:Sodium/potassium/calcium exchanger 1 n=1 Tax=Prunus yedoensis var. nudiflora TaxID=2094558 RepID=A0A314UNX6_PRUYE|nr:sodium/potassium/calcium exchanger 1 [Prunus yedoensis var. nudiflora]